MNLKITLPLFFFLLLCISINLTSAQKINIEGKVTSQADAIPLLGATVQVNEQFNTLSDEEGAFSVEVEEQEQYRIVVRMLGYETVDTTIRTSFDKIFLDVEMKEALFDLPSIEIMASSFNAFDFEGWNILDFDFLEDRLLVLYLLGRERRIGLFNQNGLMLFSVELEDKYDQIFTSCSGKIHLVGDGGGVELYIQKDQINFLKTYKRQLFDDLIQPCVAVCKQERVFKNLSDHNKKARYFKYPDPQSPVLITEIFDKKSAKVAQSYYNEIIGLYYLTVSSSGQGAIDEGFTKDNVIARGHWSGDLFDLIISNDLLAAVAYYRNVESMPIDVREFGFNDKLYLMDFVNEQLLKIDTEKPGTSKLKITGFDWHRKTKVLQDKITGNVYLLSPDDELFEFNINEKSCSLKKLLDLKFIGNFPKGFQVFNNEFYYFSYSGTNNRTAQLLKVSLP